MKSFEYNTSQSKCHDWPPTGQSMKNPDTSSCPELWSNAQSSRKPGGLRLAGLQNAALLRGPGWHSCQAQTPTEERGSTSNHTRFPMVSKDPHQRVHVGMAGTEHRADECGWLSSTPASPISFLWSFEHFYGPGAGQHLSGIPRRRMMPP